MEVKILKKLVNYDKEPGSPDMNPLEKDQTFGKPNDTLNYYKKKVELL